MIHTGGKIIFCSPLIVARYEPQGSMGGWGGGVTFSHDSIGGGEGTSPNYSMGAHVPYPSPSYVYAALCPQNDEKVCYFYLKL